MEPDFELIKQTRKNFLKLVEGLTTEQLNTVPAGFANNIIWNFGHIIAAQQSLCYRLSGLEMKMDASYVDKYGRGTKPEAAVQAEEIETLKEMMLRHIDVLKKDIEAGVFTSFQPYVTSFGFVLNNIRDAQVFFSIHDSLHFGYAMALRKAVLAGT